MLTSADFYGLSNDAAIAAGPWTDNIASGGQIPQSQFAEMAIDLTAAGVVLACPSNGFGEVNVRTRSSIADSAALKDYASAPIDIPANCGGLTWQKQDASGHALPGATFTVSPTPFTGAAGTVRIPDYVSSSPQSDPTKDQDRRAGFFQLDNVVPGTYTVTETVPPTGYLLDSHPSQTVTVTQFTTVNVDYIWKNPRKSATTTLVLWPRLVPLDPVYEIAEHEGRVPERHTEDGHPPRLTCSRSIFRTQALSTCGGSRRGRPMCSSRCGRSWGRSKNLVGARPKAEALAAEGHVASSAVYGGANEAAQPERDGGSKQPEDDLPAARAQGT